MTTDMRTLDSPDKIAEAGERIYTDRYKAELEATRSGHFIAIDVLSGAGYVAEFPEEALQEARTKAPSGIFHLIRIGAEGAFKVSFGAHVRHDFWGWPLRQSR